MMPALRRYSQSPFDLMRDFDRMFAAPETAEWERTAAYPCDIRETSDQLIVEAELPGFKKDEIDVSVEQGVLTIDAHREEKEQEGEQHLRERTYRRVQRRFTLPTTVDAEKVDAKLDGGVLTLSMPKKEEVRPRKIEVK
jgi:HSP20 family protein